MVSARWAAYLVIAILATVALACLVALSTERTDPEMVRAVPRSAAAQSASAPVNRHDAAAAPAAAHPHS